MSEKSEILRTTVTLRIHMMPTGPMIIDRPNDPALKFHVERPKNTHGAIKEVVNEKL